jgi:hypothetical protein
MMNRLTHFISDYSSFRSSMQTIRTRCRMYRQTPGYCPFYPMPRMIGNRHAVSPLLGSTHRYPNLSSETGEHTIGRRVRIKLTTTHRLG